MKHRSILYPFLILSILALTAIGCGKDDKGGGGDKGSTAGEKTAPASGGAAAKVEAKKIFKTRCALCHGENGMGNGPSAASLDPKPQNYTDATWQKSVTDEELRKAIVEGGAAVGKSPVMAPNPDLGKPEKAAVLDEIIKIVRSFGN